MATPTPFNGPPVPASGPLPSSIAAALESNAALQSELQRRLLGIKRLKVQNRRDAARVAASMARCCNNDNEGVIASSGAAEQISLDMTDQSNLDEDSAGNNGPVKGRAKTVHFDGEGDGECIDPESKPATRAAPNPAANLLDSKKWAVNPSRKGTRGFFVDPDGSTPDLSRDDIMGSGGEEVGQMARVAFDKKPHTSLKEPQKTWDKARKRKWPSSFEEVDIRIDRTSLGSEQNRPTTQFTFADAGKSKAKFNKQESLFIKSAVEQSNEDQSGIDWQDLAVELNAKFGRHQTPWQIFRHYRSTLQNPSSRIPPWSPDEDELLLKYLAAHGPQFTLQGDDMVQLCKNLFPLRNPAQLLLRTGSTLLNPNYRHEAWDTDEKRKLALLMRVYGDEKNPVYLASQPAHFPQRAQKSVTEKWIRTLDPSLSHRPVGAGEGSEWHDEANPDEQTGTAI
ncbi:hypothetical protein ACHAXT_008094 [Thalassiosira profunda]